MAKTLKIEISEPAGDDKYYLAAMLDGEQTALLNEQEKQDFLAYLTAK